MLPEGYAVRLATLADCEALPAIEHAAAEMFRPLNLINFDDGIDVAPVDFLERQCGEGLLWVATKDETPEGFVVVDVREGDYYVSELDVHPDHGRKGLGAALMKVACDEAFARGFDRVTLNTFRDVPWNAPFYARLGFTEIAEADWRPWMIALAGRMEQSGMDLKTRVYMELRR